MNYNENTKKILGEQKISCEDHNNILTSIIRETDSLYQIVVHAYYLGLINGKQAERTRRAQRYLPVSRRGGNENDSSTHL